MREGGLEGRQIGGRRLKIRGMCGRFGVMMRGKVLVAGQEESVHRENGEENRCRERIERREENKKGRSGVYQDGSERVGRHKRTDEST